MAKKDLRDAVIKIKDGTGVPLETTIVMGEGNLTYTVSNPMEYETDRGIVASGTVRKGPEVPVEVSITGQWVDVISADAEPVTPYEAIFRKGAAAAWVSTGADSCEPYACEIEITFTPDCTGGTTKKDEVIVFNEFRGESCAFDISAGTIAITGKSKEVEPTVTRPT